MHFKDLPGSIARVGYCIPVPDLLSSATLLSMPKKHYNGLIISNLKIRGPGHQYQLPEALHCTILKAGSLEINRSTRTLSAHESHSHGQIKAVGSISIHMSSSRPATGDTETDQSHLMGCVASDMSHVNTSIFNQDIVTIAQNRITGSAILYDLGIL